MAMRMVRARPRKARLVACLALACAVATSGCESVARGGDDYLVWSGDTFGGNYVTVVPFVIGFIGGALGAVPLLLISVPMTMAFYPDDGDRELRNVSHFSPCFYLGATCGILTALPFYPLGLPFELFGSEDEDEEELGEEHEHDHGHEHPHGEGEADAHEHGQPPPEDGNGDQPPAGEGEPRDGTEPQGADQRKASSASRH